MKKLTLNKIVSTLNLEIISGADKMDQQIDTYGLNRAGLELTGYFEKGEKSHRLILMSTKELNYIMQFNEQERRARYEQLLSKKFPGILLTTKFTDELFFKIAKEKNFPVVLGGDSTAILSKAILDILDDFLSPQTEMHASLINVFGKGVIFIGESGIGKSELAMELVKSNHLFVGDDRIVITKKNGSLFGRSHVILKNLVEVRGIGIIDVAKTNGYKVIMDESPIDLVIELSIFKKDGVDDSERLGKSFQTYRILDQNIPYIKIPVSSGRNIQNIIEVAVSKLKISQSGLYKDDADLLTERLQQFRDEN
ncbi:HPr kinase/phosphorylase [Spiroplasma clarkii]|uniref:HPr kinase/phosphorylase n=1 Tax=Spiroplasma clarkii TaxID=2139 RepID=A0A1Y0L2S0_9MOLU|nr:HPr(Ser) kinase/phosphatase [Spiroplasma clarkii]ARU92302.1 HPr kinase/phosphorylase [Spiroplasma clarkii]ATX71611.1 HPr kinase/phosphorylase [Spiroplasma clarkii]